MTEVEMVGWHHQLNGYEFEKTPGVGDGQGGLACCNSWAHKESDMTERLNRTEVCLTRAKVDVVKTAVKWCEWVITVFGRGF